MTTPSEIAFVNRLDKVANSLRTAYGDRTHVLLINRRRSTLVGFYDASGHVRSVGTLLAANDDRRIRPVS